MNGKSILLIYNKKLYTQKSCSALEEKYILPLSNSSTYIWNISEDDDSAEDYFNANNTDIRDCNSS